MHANIAVFWAEHVIKILNHHGVHHFCLAPGARSTPLVMALSHNKHVKVTTHFDERALGFFALGVAKATESPVAIITTSGSAVANLLPSAVEATHAHVPLIFLTADRPQELQNCGANQAINQEAIFGTFVKKFEALPVPSPAIELSSMLTKGSEVVQIACVADRGPVHINCPFREPFLESNVTLKNNFQHSVSLNQPYQTKISETTNKPVQFNSKHEKKSILGICGWLPHRSDYQRVTQFCKERSIPLIAEIHAGVGDGFGMVDLILAELKKSKVDQVLLFGSHIISKQLLKFLKEHQHVLQLSGVYREVDPTRSFDVVNGPLVETIQKNTCFGNKNFGALKSDRIKSKECFLQAIFLT